MGDTVKPQTPGGVGLLLARIGAERGRFSDFALEVKDIHSLNFPYQYVPYNVK
jgi:hypothetical protein